MFPPWILTFWPDGALKFTAPVLAVSEPSVPVKLILVGEVTLIVPVELVIVPLLTKVPVSDLREMLLTAEMEGLAVEAIGLTVLAVEAEEGELVEVEASELMMEPPAWSVREPELEMVPWLVMLFWEERTRFNTGVEDWLEGLIEEIKPPEELRISLDLMTSVVTWGLELEAIMVPLLTSPPGKKRREALSRTVTPEGTSRLEMCALRTELTWKEPPVALPWEPRMMDWEPERDWSTATNSAGVRRVVEVTAKETLPTVMDSLWKPAIWPATMEGWVEVRSRLRRGEERVWEEDCWEGELPEREIEPNCWTEGEEEEPDWEEGRESEALEEPDWEEETEVAEMELEEVFERVEEEPDWEERDWEEPDWEEGRESEALEEPDWEEETEVAEMELEEVFERVEEERDWEEPDW
jgi:hypothetical protein